MEAFRIYIEICILLACGYFGCTLRDMIRDQDVDLLCLIIETFGVFVLWPYWLLAFLIDKLEDYLNHL